MNKIADANAGIAIHFPPIGGPPSCGLDCSIISPDMEDINFDSSFLYCGMYLNKFLICFLGSGS